MGLSSSVLSYPNRGHYGKAGYRGNTTGRILVDLFRALEPESVCDPAEGGGTTRDVCKEMGIDYQGLDLRDGFDLLSMDLRSRLASEPDCAFFHPPYHDIIHYSGKMWGDPHPHDLSRCRTLAEFYEKLQFALLNIYRAIRRGGHYAVLIGDIRRKGAYFSPQARLQSWGLGQLKGVLIKMQHNTMSASRSYGKLLSPIMHEYLLVFQKPNAVQSLLDWTKGQMKNVHFIQGTTWRNVVKVALMERGGEATLSELYQTIEGVSKAEGREHWRAKVRQVLQLYPEFERVSEGRWKITVFPPPLQ